MSYPEIALPISSPRSENKTTCDFYVESIESYTNPDQHGSGYGLDIKKVILRGFQSRSGSLSIIVTRFELGFGVLKSERSRL